MEDTVKKFRITGEAAKSFLGGGGARGTRGKRVKLQKGGAQPLEGTPLIQTGSAASAASAAPVAPVVQRNVASAVPATAAPASPSAPPTQPLYTGGAKVVKVILDKSKNKTRKIILSAPKRVIKLASGSSEDISKKHPAKTQKVARRIRVSVDGLKRRVHRAKTIKKESQTMTIDKIKKELEKAGLIKTDSKAPELILRQMYTDYQMLKQRAL